MLLGHTEKVDHFFICQVLRAGVGHLQCCESLSKELFFARSLFLIYETKGRILINLRLLPTLTFQMTLLSQ